VSHGNRDRIERGDGKYNPVVIEVIKSGYKKLKIIIGGRVKARVVREIYVYLVLGRK
jgi:hypothetical protein